MNIKGHSQTAQHALSLNPVAQAVQLETIARGRNVRSHNIANEHINTVITQPKVVGPDTFNKADAFREQRAHYDQPHHKARMAMQSYSQAQFASQREELTSLLGVDVYA